MRFQQYLPWLFLFCLLGSLNAFARENDKDCVEAVSAKPYLLDAETARGLCQYKWDNNGVFLGGLIDMVTPSPQEKFTSCVDKGSASQKCVSSFVPPKQIEQANQNGSTRNPSSTK